MTQSDALRDASERVATRFSRPMRAATSPIGVLTDPPVVSAMIAVVAVPAILLLQMEVIGPEALPILGGLALLPVVVAIAVTVLLGGARDRVVGWIAEQPFPIDNMNAVLNGIGQTLVIRFDGEPPPRDALNEVLERIHDDCFALEFDEEEPEIEVRIGIADSKWNPAAAAHRRFVRVQRIIEDALVPFSEKHPIAWVRVS